MEFSSQIKPKKYHGSWVHGVALPLSSLTAWTKAEVSEDPGPTRKEGISDGIEGIKGWVSKGGNCGRVGRVGSIGWVIISGCLDEGTGTVIGGSGGVCGASDCENWRNSAVIGIGKLGSECNGIGSIGTAGGFIVGFFSSNTMRFAEENWVLKFWSIKARMSSCWKDLKLEAIVVDKSLISWDFIDGEGFMQVIIC